MQYILSHKRQLITLVISVALSFLLVFMMASAVTYVDTDSVGIATATPGAALGVKGGALIDGFVRADYFWATSTTASSIGGNLGLASTTPGAMLAVKGLALIDGGLRADYLWATSTTASSIGGNLGLASTTPGAMLAVKGLAIVGGGVWADYVVATSTSVAMGFGTSTPGTEFAADGLGYFGGGLVTSYLRATSTITSSFGGNLGLASTSPSLMLAVEGFGAVKGDWNVAGTSTLSSIIATSTVQVGTSTVSGAQLAVVGSGYLTGGLGVGATASTSGSFITKGDGVGLLVDGASGLVAIGTSTIPGRNDQGTVLDSTLTVSAAATSSLFIASEGNGSQIILKSTDGNGCVAISATAGGKVIGSQNEGIGLTVKVVGCPF